MASHFSTLGFDVTSRDDLEALAMRVTREGDVIQVPDGKYVVWHADGIELWAQTMARAR